MVTLKNEWKQILSDKINNLLKELSQEYKASIEPLKNADPQTMVECYLMYSAVKDSQIQALRKLDYNF